jgi:hypothetical protein
MTSWTQWNQVLYHAHVFESITHGALLSTSSFWPFVGEIGMEPFGSFCEYAECYYNKQE